MRPHSQPLSIILVCISAFGCQAKSTSRPAHQAEASAEVQQCTRLAFPIMGQPGRLTAAQRCALVETALHAIATGNMSTDSSVDTARITSAMVTYFAFKDTSGTPLPPYWSIDFSVKNVPYDASVHIYPTTGRITTGRVHK